MLRFAWTSCAVLSVSIVVACDAGTETNDTGTSSGGFLQTSASTGFVACEAIRVTADLKPLNLYIAMDASSSMAGNKWDAAKAGLSAWAHDQKADGIQVALSFFPRPAGGPPACDPSGYVTPVVDYGLLVGHADALDAAMNARSPDGFSSPVYPALGGALTASLARIENKPGEVAAVLLVTDGKPQGPAATCGGVNPEDAQVIADLAATGTTFDPPITTYVVGLPGVDQTIANQIAAAGGSDAAILVAATNVETQFRDALSKVRGDAIPCSYEIPDSLKDGETSVNAVNIEITQTGQEPAILPQDSTCVAEGWRYDDATTSIVLCPATCERLKADVTASIEVLLGCATIVR